MSHLHHFIAVSISNTQTAISARLGRSANDPFARCDSITNGPCPFDRRIKRSARQLFAATYLWTVDLFDCSHGARGLWIPRAAECSRLRIRRAACVPHRDATHLCFQDRNQVWSLLYVSTLRVFLRCTTLLLTLILLMQVSPHLYLVTIPSCTSRNGEQHDKIVRSRSDSST